MRRWEDNIRMDLRGVGWAIVDWIYVGQGRDTVMNIQITCKVEVSRLVE
jgi:hypothetical protein